MSKIVMLLSFVTFAAVFSTNVPAYAGGGTFGIGFKAGVDQLDGDWHKPKLNPIASLSLSYNPFPYLTIGGAFGYSALKTKDLMPWTNPAVKDASSFQTVFAPIEANITFNLFPLAKLNPFATIGGGGVWWNATYDGKTVQRVGNNQKQKGVDRFVKAEGGVELRVNRNIGISLSAAFRYSFTDMLDQVGNGDENDAVTSACIGMTYYFRPKTKGDMDGDGIPDIVDLDPKNAEDKNGYLDHDGKPDGNPPVSKLFGKLKDKSDEQGNIGPIVIHHPVAEVEEKRPIKIVTDIYEDNELRVASVLYRTIGTKDWKIKRLQKKDGTRYEATIPGENVTPAGLEYCVLAVDQAVSGVGRAGWPKQPIRINVNKNASTWRILGGTVAAISWCFATYIMLRKQSIP